MLVKFYVMMSRIKQIEKSHARKSCNLFEGIFGWVNSDQPIYNKTGVMTKKIHSFNKNWSKWLKKGEKVY